jgi:hypothetical protein
VNDATVEARIAEWRGALSRSAAVTDADADELESHLRDRIADLEASGLDADEAFLIAVKRLGATDAVTAEFAREHGDRLWKQLVLPTARGPRDRSFVEMIVFAALAVVGCSPSSPRRPPTGSPATSRSSCCPCWRRTSCGCGACPCAQSCRSRPWWPCSP